MKSLTSALLATTLLTFAISAKAIGDTDTSKLKEFLEARASMLKPLYEEVPEEFLKARVIVRRGIDDFDGMAVLDYLRRLHLAAHLSDEGCSWNSGTGLFSSGNQYELTCSYSISGMAEKAVEFSALFKFILSDDRRSAGLRIFESRTGKETDAYKSSLQLLGEEPGDFFFEGNDDLRKIFDDFKKALE